MDQLTQGHQEESKSDEPAHATEEEAKTEPEQAETTTTEETKEIQEWGWSKGTGSFAPITLMECFNAKWKILRPMDLFVHFYKTHQPISPIALSKLILQKNKPL